MKGTGKSVRLKPADPFDLIRWLARTQSDPRKAVAELVQNSIDAGARTIRVERKKLRGHAALIIRDDGEGVLPALEREAALQYIATHIGHSRKLGLSPSERQARVVAGKYGVGLLGFWAIGAQMEIRSRVGGSACCALRLVENRQDAELFQLPAALDAPATFTEIVVTELHAAAARVLGGRRLADYLAAELRGGLLASGVELEVHDHTTKGVAQKRFPVVPRRFEGERLDLAVEIAIRGYPPARVELYLVPGVERPAIQVSCAGTLVADDVADLRALGLDERPWTGCELTGLIDFAAFTVPPGTRRGVAPDAAAQAFADGLAAFAPAVEAELKRLARERQSAVDRQVVAQLKKALRGLDRRLPQLELPPVTDGASVPPELDGAPVAPDGPEDDDRPAPLPPLELFPPGPLHAVRIVPASVTVAPGAERRIRAEATDADGRAIRAGVTFRWSVDRADFELRGDGSRPAVTARADVPLGQEAAVRVSAGHDGVWCHAFARVVAALPPERADGGGGLGIPDPEIVDDPGGGWRSRFAGTRWQVNGSHDDYIALRGDPRTRLRYLINLLAKEIVLRSFPGPGNEGLLEQTVAILAHAERNLRGS